MENQTIRFKVDLVVQLFDTTTGRSVDERDVILTKNGAAFPAGGKGDGNFISVNSGREDFSLGVKVKGYEDCTVNVSYENLDKVMPVQAVYLVPKDIIKPGTQLLTFAGKLPGLESIEAVCLSDTCCNIQSFDERKRIMQVYSHKGYHGMYHKKYGLISGDGESYEEFEILKDLSSNSVKITKPLENSFFVNQSICRIIYGKVYGDSSFVLRTNDDRAELKFIVRYVVNGETRFMKVDFHDLDNVELT